MTVPPAEESSFPRARFEDRAEILINELNRQAPKPSASQDTVICNSVLHSFGFDESQVRDSLRHIREMLRPGDHVFVGEILQDSEIRRNCLDLEVFIEEINGLNFSKSLRLTLVLHIRKISNRPIFLPSNSGFYASRDDFEQILLDSGLEGTRIREVSEYSDKAPSGTHGLGRLDYFARAIDT